MMTIKNQRIKGQQSLEVFEGVCSVFLKIEEYYLLFEELFHEEILKCNLFLKDQDFDLSNNTKKIIKKVPVKFRAKLGDYRCKRD